MKLPGLQLTLPKSSCCSIPPSHVAVEFFCHISIIMTVQKGAACTHRETNPQQPLSAKKLCMWLLLQAEVAWLPKWDGGVPGWAVPENPTCSFPLVLQVVLAKPRANTARATASQRCQGVENTHGLDHALWTELPTACTRCQIPLPPVLFQY